MHWWAYWITRSPGVSISAANRDRSALALAGAHQACRRDAEPHPVNRDLREAGLEHRQDEQRILVDEKGAARLERALGGVDDCFRHTIRQGRKRQSGENIIRLLRAMGGENRLDIRCRALDD